MLQICHQRKEEEVFVQIGEESNIPRPKPLVIHFTRESIAPTEVHHVVIQISSPFPYKNDKAVPWKYGISVLNNDLCERQENKTTDVDKTDVDNISGIRGMMRSGRLFTPPELRNDKSLEKANEEVTIEKAKAFLKGKALQVDQEPEGKSNRKFLMRQPVNFCALYSKASTKWLIN